MPFLSEERHKHPYVAQPNNAADLKDIELLLQTIRALPIHAGIKKKMLNHAIWLVAEVSGNFRGRYRSAGVLKTVGVPIQRDHVFPRKMLVEELLLPEANVTSVIERSQCCIVTREEHKLLTKVPQQFIGWERYKQAGVIVHDMQEL
jgi:hypothetical protein